MGQFIIFAKLMKATRQSEALEIAIGLIDSS